MRKEFPLSQEDFNNLLKWLSPDREEAGEKYEKIRDGLVRFFRFHRCGDPLALADETINRVANKVSAFTVNEKIKTISFFYGFAKKILLEYKSETAGKEIQIEPGLPLKDKYAFNSEENLEFDCLEKCLAELPTDERKMVINYYSKDKSAKFEFRKKMAEKMNMRTGTLHTKVHRIRRGLRKCIENCLEKNSL